MKQCLLTGFFLKDLSAKKLVKEANNIPHVISSSNLAENVAGKKRVTFDLSQVNEQIYNQKVKFDDWKSFENSLNIYSKYVLIEFQTWVLSHK